MHLLAELDKKQNKCIENGRAKRVHSFLWDSYHNDTWPKSRVLNEVYNNNNSFSHERFHLHI